jgi:hypothetical protein
MPCAAYKSFEFVFRRFHHAWRRFGGAEETLRRAELRLRSHAVQLGFQVIPAANGMRLATCWKDWLRGMDLNQRPLGYEFAGHW